MLNKYNKAQNRCREVLQNATYEDQTSKYVDNFLAALVVINIIAVALESVTSIYIRFSQYFDLIELISVLIFTIEYL